MAKKCTICGKDALFKIKDSSDYYCDGCAQDYFADVSMLVRVEDEAKKLKKAIEEKYEELEDEEASKTR